MSGEDPRKYVRVLRDMREQIEDGTLRPGQPTPTIETLCIQFSCVRQTAGKALMLLADEGMLVRYPGLGYYVAGEEEPRTGFPRAENAAWPAW